MHLIPRKSDSKLQCAAKRVAVELRNHVGAGETDRNIIHYVSRLETAIKAMRDIADEYTPDDDSKAVVDGIIDYAIGNDFDRASQFLHILVDQAIKGIR